jgi:hypothetical protein
LWFRHLDTKQRLAVGAGTLTVAALVIGLSFVTASGAPGHHAAGSTSSSSSSSSSSTSTTPHPRLSSHLCPLTGTSPSGGRVPARPALGVKIGNDPASRPQSGLPEADIVYEEMAEGGITRYLAIFQCKSAGALGPVRSVRWDDWHVLASYGNPILAFSGGITQWDDEVASLRWLHDANGSNYPTSNAYYRTNDRVPPWNYYSSTKALYGLFPKAKTPPPPQFTYSKEPPAGSTSATGATIGAFATGANVVWKWDASKQAYMRYYESGGVLSADLDAGGRQLQAVNVIIELVATRRGPYAESGTVPDVESITQGSGTAYVLRNGKVEVGTWSCKRYGDVTNFRFNNGPHMTLSPGNTWVELVPNHGYPVAISR